MRVLSDSWWSRKGAGASQTCRLEDEMDGQILEGKRILVVDDEPDILET
jgi:hypothetical protein